MNGGNKTGLRRAPIARRTIRYAVSTLLAAAVASTMQAPMAMARDTAGAATGDNVVLQWNAAMLEATRQAPLGPPMTARALGIATTCMFDAWAAYDRVAVGTRLGGTLRRPAAEHTNANKSEAISYAAHQAAVNLYPSQKGSFDNLLTSLGHDPSNRSTDPATPAGVGHRACGAVLDYRATDGSNQSNNYADTSGYTPSNDPMVVAEPIDPATVRDPNAWQPLTHPDRSGRVSTPEYIGPHWGGVTTFAVNAKQLARSMPGPAKWASQVYISQAREVIDISANLTDRQKAIAEYWADGPGAEQPPGHWFLFAEYVSHRDNHTLDQDVKLSFALGNAVMDAGIAAWYSKRHYNHVRPITAIRWLWNGRQIQAWGGPGQGTQTIDGGTWLPYQPEWFPTPPFAEYVSGHSAFSAAAAHILKNFTGSDAFGASHTVPAGASFVEPGVVPAQPVTLSWSTFTEAADEAGISRLYGGIHFRYGDIDGRTLGRLAASDVWSKANSYIDGTVK